MADPVWKDDVDDHDYQAAYAYLTILLDHDRASSAVARLRTKPVIERRANDILRGCHREPLPPDDPGVQHDDKKIRHGKPLSPVLIVSFQQGGDIADGFHRVSAIYQQDPFAKVPCKLAHVPELA